jgi:hypothetical protein
MADANEPNQKLTFEEAIERARDLLEKCETKRLSDAEVSVGVEQLVVTAAGARGFFAYYLTSDLKITEAHPDAVIEGLSRSQQFVVELVAKNLVMSSAMVVTHRQNQSEQLLEGSERVVRRLQTLAPRIWNDQLLHHLESMLYAVDKVRSQSPEQVAPLSPDDEPSLNFLRLNDETIRAQESFLRKWRYDNTQLESARQSLLALLRLSY